VKKSTKPNQDEKPPLPAIVAGPWDADPVEAAVMVVIEKTNALQKACHQKAPFEDIDIDAAGRARSAAIQTLAKLEVIERPMWGK
jgi:hypothetical protein